MSQIQTSNQTNKDLRKIETISERVGPVKSLNHVREFTFVTDQSTRAGGTGEAPSPMEYILGSFNGCILVVVERIAEEIGFNFTHLKTKSTGTIDPRGMRGVDNISPHFQQVTNTLWFETEESKARIEELKKEVKKRCPALNLFYDAGIEVTLNWIHQELEDENE